MLLRGLHSCLGCPYPPAPWRLLTNIRWWSSHNSYYLAFYCKAMLELARMSKQLAWNNLLRPFPCQDDKVGSITSVALSTVEMQRQGTNNVLPIFRLHIPSPFKALRYLWVLLALNFEVDWLCLLCVEWVDVISMIRNGNRSRGLSPNVFLCLQSVLILCLPLLLLSLYIGNWWGKQVACLQTNCELPVSSSHEAQHSEDSSWFSFSFSPTRYLPGNDLSFCPTCPCTASVRVDKLGNPICTIPLCDRGKVCILQNQLLESTICNVALSLWYGRSPEVHLDTLKTGTFMNLLLPFASFHGNNY